MRINDFFLPILKENPSEAQITSHRLMLRAGMIKQITSGIYTWLPLGLRVLRKIENIIREEMNKAGANEVVMPMTQPAELWQKSGRFEAYGKEMLRFKDRNERDMLFGPTHEEVVHEVFRSGVTSYKSLPVNLYQIHYKFRDEIRPRFGVMRAREFLMKDGYSFDVDFESAKKTYDGMYKAYLNIFSRIGVTAIPVLADSGAIGGNLCHEFQILAPNGESEVFYQEELADYASGKKALDVDAMQKLYAATDEKHDQAHCPVPAAELKQDKGIEVGHIFYYATKYSDAMGVTVTGSDGKPLKVHGGCYGIGVSRVVAAIIEASHDAAGIIWPEAVAPFKVALLNLKPKDEKCTKMADQLYKKLSAKGIEVLLDDSDESAGSKFAVAELIGVPFIASIGPRGAEAGTIEIKNRKTGAKHDLPLNDTLDFLGI
jgi:prolyl-tRNA synthetase